MDFQEESRMRSLRMPLVFGQTWHSSSLRWWDCSSSWCRRRRRYSGACGTGGMKPQLYCVLPRSYTLVHLLDRKSASFLGRPWRSD
jgi:hypothetical protein